MTTVVRDTVLISGFVFVMMLCVEYANVLTRGALERRVASWKIGQYVLAAALGLTPGCLGAFAVVAMYSHRVVTIGAVVTAMIATSGDESFVMLALIPRDALALGVVLLPVAVVSGMSADRVARHAPSFRKVCEVGMVVHQDEECECLPRGGLLHVWRNETGIRVSLVALLLAFSTGLVLGWWGPADWNWMRVSVLVTAATAAAIIASVPAHFLRQHLWKHVARTHLPRIFLWTLCALTAIWAMKDWLDVGAPFRDGDYLLVLLASLTGIIPESGPHLVFVTLYAKGAVPFSVLLASSIVQDGHGMLPMLAHSKRAFLVVKGVNLAVGLLLGGVAVLLGH